MWNVKRATHGAQLLAHHLEKGHFWAAVKLERKPPIKQYPLLNLLLIDGTLLLSFIQYSYVPFQSIYPDQLNSARGKGFFAAVDVRDASHRNKLVGELLKKGKYPKMSDIKLSRVYLLGNSGLSFE